MFTLLCAISIQILKFFCKDRRLLLYMSRTLHLFGTDWCAMMVPIQVIRWYRMQCYDGTDSCATVVPIRRYCHQTFSNADSLQSLSVNVILNISPLTPGQFSSSIRKGVMPSFFNSLTSISMVGSAKYPPVYNFCLL